MQISDMQHTIAHQLDHMLPEGWIPGIDVGFEPSTTDPNTLTVKRRDGHVAEVTYDEGMDLYNVFVKRPGKDDVESHEGIFCDQLGEIVYGEQASTWTLPMGAVVTFNEDGSVAEVTEF